jgi:butyryl-CoA dehydrogenase
VASPTFIVPTSTPGFNRAQPDRKMGISAAPLLLHLLRGHGGPAKNLLGKEGDGFKVAMSTLEGGRIGIASQAIGIARAAVRGGPPLRAGQKDLRPAHRQPPGDPVHARRHGHEIDAARLLTLKAALLKDQRLRHGPESAMAEALRQREWPAGSANKGLQIHGGPRATARSSTPSGHVRDARHHRDLRGTSEIQRIVISAAPS